MRKAPAADCMKAPRTPHLHEGFSQVSARIGLPSYSFAPEPSPSSAARTEADLEDHYNDCKSYVDPYCPRRELRNRPRDPSEANHSTTVVTTSADLAGMGGTSSFS